MSRMHISPHAYQTTRTFVEVGLGAVVGVVSLITAATLIVAWFFT